MVKESLGSKRGERKKERKESSKGKKCHPFFSQGKVGIVWVVKSSCLLDWCPQWDVDIFILNGFPCPLYRTLQLCQPPPEGEQHEMSVIFIEGCLWKWSFESESAPLPHSDMLYVIFLSMASCLPAIRDLCLMLLSRLIPPIKIFFSAVILCAPRCPSYHLIWTWNYLHYYNQRVTCFHKCHSSCNKWNPWQQPATLLP